MEKGMCLYIFAIAFILYIVFFSIILYFCDILLSLQKMMQIKPLHISNILHIFLFIISHQ